MVRTARKALSSEQIAAAVKFVRESDFDWWFLRKRVGEAREITSKHIRADITTAAFRSIREDVCEWFKVRKRPAPSKNIALDAKEWEQLRAAVKRSLPLIQGRTLGQAVAIVSLECRCNEFVLDGLASDLHVWIDPKGDAA